MSENALNHDQVRFKLSALANAWIEKLPEITNQSKSAGMTEKMLLNSIRPFLPKLQDSLESKIESLSDSEIEKMIEKLESAFQWVKADA